MKLKLPSPKDLGHPSALPMRNGPGNPNNEYSWEDYHEYIEKNYPIRNFIFNEIPMWFTVKISMPIKESIYWLKCQTYKKYHLLDLRQPGKEGYKYGWVDSDSQMLYALFNILVNFVEKEIDGTLDENIKFHKEMVDTEQESDTWHAAYLEIKELYNYWKFDRPYQQKQMDDNLSEWDDNRIGNKPKAEILFKEYHDLESEFEEKETEMLIRLIKVRKWMWT
jgi:hypothetical protein